MFRFRPPKVSPGSEGTWVFPKRPSVQIVPEGRECQVPSAKSQVFSHGSFRLVPSGVPPGIIPLKGDIFFLWMIKVLFSGLRTSRPFMSTP